MAESDSIVVDDETPVSDEAAPKEVGGELVSWIMDKVDPWRQHRDTSHANLWDEYYRIWRGMFTSAEGKKKQERSKIVAPATMQAVDSSVAEIEEAIFGREQWIDLEDDYEENVDKEQRDEMLAMRDRLMERMERDKIPNACSKSFLIAAVFGTGIGKINTSVRKRKVRVEGNESTIPEPYVELIPLEPYEFVPDPTTDNLDDMLGMAHETMVPYHLVRQNMIEGLFREVTIDAWDGEIPGDSKDEAVMKKPGGDAVFITEYHGKVPARFLTEVLESDGGLERDEVLHEKLEKSPAEDYLVEAIVTIGNKGVLLRAMKNPFLFEDRCFIAYQHDTVPNYFWGRGVPEKGYNPQKALDAELRARLDALGLISHPMIAGDITRLPRGMNLGVWPGKFWGTTGAPSEVLQPFNFGNLNQATFTQAGDMERMVQMATGSFDPGGASAQQSASNTALNSSGFIKRARRTMQAIERNWMKPLIQKTLWRYMQFEPGQFANDPKFCVKGTLGIMAREFEQQQLIQMLSIVPQGSPMSMILMKAIFDNSSSPHKKDMVKAVDQFLAPPDEEAQKAQQEQAELEKRGKVAAVAKLEAEAAKAQAEAAKAQALGQKALAEVDYMDEELASKNMDQAINLREVQAFEMQNQVSMMMQQLRAFDLALKAKQVEANIEKSKAQAKAIQSK